MDEPMDVMRTHSGTRARARFAALALVFVVAPLARAGDSPDHGESRGADAQVERILADCVALSESQTTPVPASAECVRRLAALGRNAAPALFARFASQLARPGASALDESGSEDARVAALLLAAIVQLPRDAVRTVLASRSGEDSTPLERRAAVAVWGEYAVAQDLELVCAVAARELDADGEPNAASVVFERALARMAARDPSVWNTLRKFAQRDPASRVRSYLRAASCGRGAGSLAYLTWAVETLPARRVEAVVELQRASFGVALPVDEDVTRAVRRVLELRPPDVLSELAMVAGRFEDSEAVPTLIELLTVQSPGARASALWALQRISKLGFHADAARWHYWYDEEVAWWRTQSNDWIQRLSDTRAGEVRRAIVELTKRRLYRERAALAIARVLSDDDADTVVLACRSLEQLGSRACVPALVAALEHRSADARLAAWTTLRKLTGKDFGQDARAWSEVTTRP